MITATKTEHDNYKVEVDGAILGFIVPVNSVRGVGYRFNTRVFGTRGSRTISPTPEQAAQKYFGKRINFVEDFDPTIRCHVCNAEVSNHPDDCNGGVAFCGDCGKPTCAEHRDGSAAQRCTLCGRKS